MRFIDQWKLGNAGAGTYALTVAMVMLALIIGTFISESLSVSVLGYSLARLPEHYDENSVLSLLLLPFAIALLALMLSIRRLHNRPVLTLFTARSRFDWKRFFLSFFIWGGVMGVFLAVSIWFGAPVKWNFNPSTFFMLLLVSLFIMPLQTTAEEVFFRGFLFQGLGHLFGKPWIGIVIPGVLFGLLHWSNPEVEKIGDVLLVFYIGTGIFLGLLTHFDNGLELGLGYHAVNNIFASLILTNDWQAFQTDALLIDYSPPSFNWEIVLTLLVFQPLLLWLYGWLYKWNIRGGNSSQPH